MAFDLRITITGLCMFVPDPLDQSMHILMPSSAGMSGDANVHYPRLMFDKALEARNSPKFGRRLRCRNLERAAWVLPAYPEDPIDLTIPDELVNLETAAGADPVARDFVRSTPDLNALTSRVTFRAGGITDYSLGLRFALGKVEVPMTTRIEWTIRGLNSERGSLSADALGEVIGLENGQSQDIIKLFPAKELFPMRGVIHLYLYHVVKDELPSKVWRWPSVEPPDPQDPDPVKHFPMYYNLAKCQNPPRIRYVSDDVLKVDDCGFPNSGGGAAIAVGGGAMPPGHVMGAASAKTEGSTKKGIFVICMSTSAPLAES